MTLFVNNMFRDYQHKDKVDETYYLNHANQTVDFVRQKKEQHLQFNKGKMTIWQSMDLLNSLIDESDPDTNLPQNIHAFQTAESLRVSYPQLDWLHLVGLIHDLGKILSHPLFGSEPQWAVVGDTFPVGCAFSQEIVYSEYFPMNPDSSHPNYNTKYGIYSEGCGLDNVEFSWGHDEYMYQVCLHNKCTLPEIGLAMIRYHSFYPWHHKGAYTYLMNAADKEKLEWVQKFQRHDLYTKKNIPPASIEDLKMYYQGLIEKYFPHQVLEW